MKKILSIIVLVIIITLAAVGCDKVGEGTRQDTNNTRSATNELQANQPTPTDISYSLERYNLIRRAYWVNGSREKANALPCEIEKPLGYIVLFSGNAVVSRFVVDGKVSSLNSYLTPDTYYGYLSSANGPYELWLADIDGTYGENDGGIFFFTPDGKYIEWSGDYLYSDIPFTVEAPVVNIGGVEK